MLLQVNNTNLGRYAELRYLYQLGLPGDLVTSYCFNRSLGTCLDMESEEEEWTLRSFLQALCLRIGWPKLEVRRALQ